MYLLFTILLPLFIILLIINRFRKKKIIKRINCLCQEEKYDLINELLQPFGYNYIPSQDIFSTRIDAWQRSMGYCHLYDIAAPGLNMVFDYLPVYFNYRGRTWLLELWKGQYGINTGGEIGLYYADRILDKNEYKTTLFQCATDDDMVPLYFTLFRKETSCATLSQVHWWLTAFCLGLFSKPSELALQASVTFPNNEMTAAFINGLFEAGFSMDEIKRYHNTLSFAMSHTHSAEGFFRKLQAKNAQWQNRFWCGIYLHVTRPFTASLDRVLYLYYYLPFAFRKTLRIHKTTRKQRRL